MTENNELSEGERKVVSAILDQLGLVYPFEESLTCLPSQMNAAHLLVSALEGEGNNQNKKNPPLSSFHINEYSFVFNLILELPDETLNMLSGSSPEFLEAFDKLVSYLLPLPFVFGSFLSRFLEHVRSVQ